MFLKYGLSLVFAIFILLSGLQARETTEPTLSAEQQAALRSLIRSLETLHETTQSSEVVRLWIKSEMEQKKVQLKNVSQKIEDLKARMRAADQAKIEELHQELNKATETNEKLNKQLQALASGIRLWSQEKKNLFEEASPGYKLFVEYVRPAFQGNCASCHNADMKEGELDLTT